MDASTHPVTSAAPPPFTEDLDPITAAADAAADALAASRAAAGPIGRDAAGNADAAARRMRRADNLLAEGLANGFVEASLAFSDEMQGSSTLSAVVESTLAGLLRANGRFLAELGNAIRVVSDDVADARGEWGPSAQRAAAPLEIDYERLADAVSLRLAQRMGP